MREITRKAVVGCPVEVAITVIGGAWKLTIISNLLDGAMRYGEIKRALVRATDRTLTRQLRELEQDGLVHREVFAEVPPRVEYRLTELGESLRPIVAAVDGWGQSWLQAQPEEAAAA